MNVDKLKPNLLSSKLLIAIEKNGLKRMTEKSTWATLCSNKSSNDLFIHTFDVILMGNFRDCSANHFAIAMICLECILNKAG